MESEERLRTLIESTPDTICFKDGQGRWLEANEANLKAFGLETVDYRGKTDAELAGLTDAIYGQALSACRESDEKAWESGEAFRVEESLVCGDGSLKFFDVIKVPLFREDGGRRGIIVLGRDVTQRKVTEKANRHLEGQLRQAHKMQAVGTLAGGIAHDFNNILAAILGYAEIAMEKAQRGGPAPMELKQITKAADRASILVRQILTFSRKMGSEKAPMDINKLVNESASVIMRTIPKMISTEVKLCQEPTVVIGDTAQIQSMLLNLATNARDAMPDGGRLLIRTDLCEAKEKVCNGCGRIFSGKYVRVSVSDTGQGMDRETMNHMFDPFFTTKEVGKGTGLGMATVFGILNEHGGHVVCESAPGRGSAFHLYLPLARPDEKPQGEPGGDPLACQGRGEKILVVDDEEPLREMAQSALEHCGYRVTTAENGEQALDIYRREEYGFDLVVMDVNMPGMGGAKCLARMLKLNPKAKVLLASGYAQEEDPAGGAASRAAGYLAKPYRLAELLDVIRKLIDG